MKKFQKRNGFARRIEDSKLEWLEKEDVSINDAEQIEKTRSQPIMHVHVEAKKI